MSVNIADDPRIDPRLRQFFGAVGGIPQGQDVADRDELLARSNSEAALATEATIDASISAMMDNDHVAPSAGLRTTSYELTSAPDGNVLNLKLVRPDNDEVLPCIYYIHGGGMSYWSCYNGLYSAWGRIMAAQNIAIAMIDFRNCVRPSSVPEIAPFPAGLNDCVSGLKWVSEQAGMLGIDQDKITIAGDSGGGNLSIATVMTLNREGSSGLVKGLYALCPYIAGAWPDESLPSATENNGIAINLHGNNHRIGYGIAAFEDRNPLAWPLFSTVEDLKDFPPTMISLNEADPLRDEGLAFYRRLLQAGVKAQCRQLMGTTHATEIYPIACPDVSRHTANDMAFFARNV